MSGMGGLAYSNWGTRYTGPTIIFYYTIVFLHILLIIYKKILL
jgi:hypothetical protein